MPLAAKASMSPQLGEGAETVAGRKNMPPTLYLVTQQNCVNCPAAKQVVYEALDGTGVQITEIDLAEMDSDFEFRLLEEQVFIASTPSIIVENNGSLQMLYSGEIPTLDGIRDALEVQ